MAFIKRYFNKENLRRVLKRSVKLLPALVYIIWFAFLEHSIPANGQYTVMHSFIDDYIPFCEYFLIPYYFWFPMMGFVFAYFLLTSEKDFDYVCKLIIGGMLVALFICTIFPNGQQLRPAISELPDNIFGRLCAELYKTDTPTNVCPSVHVYNSCAAYIVVSKSKSFRKNKPVKIFFFIAAVLISLSTMFLKQHSFVDVVCALALLFVMYNIVYKKAFSKIFAKRSDREAKTSA